jgi:hypothetical protein
MTTCSKTRSHRRDNPDQARDDHGRFANEGGSGGSDSGGDALPTPSDFEGSVLEGAAARELHGLVDAAHDDIESKLSEFSDSKDELDSATDAREETEGELGDDEVYTEKADQADYEERHDAAGTEAAKAAFEARDKLQALIKAAQGHLDKINSKISEHEASGTLWTRGLAPGADRALGIAVA